MLRNEEWDHIRKKRELLLMNIEQMCFTKLYKRKKKEEENLKMDYRSKLDLAWFVNSTIWE